MRRVAHLPARSTGTAVVQVLSAFLALTVAVTEAATFIGGSSSLTTAQHRSWPSTLTSTPYTTASTAFVSKPSRVLFSLRGGDEDELSSSAASTIEFESSDDEEEKEEEEESDEEEVVEVKADAALAKSVKAATAKIEGKSKELIQAAAKASLKNALSAKKEKKDKKSSSLLAKFFTVPYIIKAILNPVTFIQMTKGYWASLFDFTYLDKKKVRKIFLIVILGFLLWL